MAALDSAWGLLSALSLAAWIYLVFAHGRFWLCDQRLPEEFSPPERWPAVTAVVPTRNEAELVGDAVGSLLAQDYPGPFRVVLVDDESEDGTAEVARRAARSIDPIKNGNRLQVRAAGPRPAGWVGKMWAVNEGVTWATDRFPDTEYWFLTDADVVHGSGNVRRLVSHAETGGLHLASLMVRLHAGRGLTRLLIPAFVYFFQKLYPFPRVNRPAARTAAAAGGCVLVRCDALKRGGGIEALRGEVIDDCALGRAIKRGGPIWLGVTTSAASVRPYSGVRDVWNMVARSAYTQLGHSRAALAGTLLGLALLYVWPPLALLGAPLHGSTPAALMGGAAWGLMATSFLPTLALYGRSPVWALALPVAGALYAGMTFDSARRHHQGRGATWKGRAGAGS